MIAKGIIKLKDVLQQMDTSAEPFSIAFVTFNRKRKEGGEVKRYTNCISTGTRNKGERKPTANPVTVAPANATSKRPDHFRNATRNLQLLPSRQIRKLHILLITEFNGKKVIL